MHQLSILAGAPPQTPLGELTAPLDSLAGFQGPTSWEGREGTGHRRWKRKGGEGRKKKGVGGLLLKKGIRWEWKGKRNERRVRREERKGSEKEGRKGVCPTNEKIVPAPLVQLL